MLPSHLRLYQKQTSLYGCCGRLEKSWISWFEKEHTYQLFRNHLNLIQSTSPPFYNDCHAKIIVMRHRHCLKNDRKANCSGKVCEDEGKYIQYIVGMARRIGIRIKSNKNINTMKSIYDTYLANNSTLIVSNTK